MARLISNCSDVKTLAAAFTKLEAYAEENAFKLLKTKSDVNKMMEACASQKPPDRAEVKFEDDGKTITATVGKAKKAMLVVGTKLQKTADPKPLLRQLDAQLTDASDKINQTLYDMFAKCTNYKHFVDVGEGGCNALVVLVKKMRADGTMGDKLIDFKANPNAITFAKTITDSRLKANAAIAEWDALAAKAVQFEGVLGQIEERFKQVAVLMAKPEQAAEVKGALRAIAVMKASIADVVNTGIPHGTDFMKLDGNTTVEELEGKMDMQFKGAIKALVERITSGTEKARGVREVHTGAAIKHLHALASMADE